MLRRAYALLTIKEIDDDKRIIKGIATTPEPDRIGDIVEPMGAKFALPMPLLWQHRSDTPVGHVTAAKPTKEGIPITARIARIDEPGTLRDDIERAWQAVKNFLVRGFNSIGFTDIEHSVLETGGWRFLEWEWLETSLVTIPANASATINSVKQFDIGAEAASGRQRSLVIPPGVSGQRHFISLRPKEAGKMKTIAEQIAALEATRAVKAARMTEVMQKSIDEGRSTDDAEKEDFDTLEREVEAIDSDLKRLRTLEKLQGQKAKPVNKIETEEDGTRVRASGEIVVRTPPQLLPGIRFARIARCYGLAKGNMIAAREIAEAQYKDDPIIGQIFKAAVLAGSTLTGNWADALIGTETSAFADFVEYLRPQTILGKFGQGGVPALRKVPFRVALVGQTAGGAGYWVGEGKAKPLTSFDFSRTSLGPLKVANIAVATMELLRDSSPSAAAILRDQLAAALRERLDIDFIDPAKAAVANISPASITNGVTPIASSGNDAGAIRNDVRALMATFVAANNPPDTAVWIMPSAIALNAASLRTPFSGDEFPGLSVNGGTFMGLPVIASGYVPNPTAGGYVVLANAQDIYLADDGGIDLSMSSEASLEMSDAPAQSALTGTGASMVSMFQTNSVAFLAERTINWLKRRSTAVAVLSAVNWGENVT